jgi:cytochrome c-type biogenesis protein CcmH/NrfG
MKPRTVAIVLGAATAAYLILAGMRSWALISSGEAAPMALGLAVLVIPVIGAWLLYREIVFGIRTQALGRRLGEEGGLPLDDLPRMPSGRAERQAADARFVEYEAQVQQAPGDWRGWYRLAIGYDDARDRKRARGAMRQAIRLHDAGPEGA